MKTHLQVSIWKPHSLLDLAIHHSTKTDTDTPILSASSILPHVPPWVPPLGITSQRRVSPGTCLVGSPIIKCLWHGCSESRRYKCDILQSQLLFKRGAEHNSPKVLNLFCWHQSCWVPTISSILSPNPKYNSYLRPWLIHQPYTPPPKVNIIIVITILTLALMA